MRKNWRKVCALSLLAVAAGPCTNYATPTADTHICVYDGSERGGQKLKFQVPPGSESKPIGQEDIKVSIPASNRFYMASRDGNVRDPLAPEFYSAFAKNSVSVEIEGQVRFRFNLSKACDWFAKHGRRNAPDGVDLAFNARGAGAESSGWLRWLAENFGVTMQQVATSVVNKYDWAAMTFDYPANADEVGDLPKGAKAGIPTKIALGFDLGRSFTAQLNQNMGGDYFCGIDASPTGEIAECPPMNFQVVKVEPVNKEMLTDRTRLNDLNEEIRNARLELNQLKSKQDLLLAQLRVAQLEAQIARAECLLLAKHGLDCEGHHPTYYTTPPN